MLFQTFSIAVRYFLGSSRVEAKRTNDDRLGRCPGDRTEQAEIHYEKLYHASVRSCSNKRKPRVESVPRAEFSFRIFTSPCRVKTRRFHETGSRISQVPEALFENNGV